MSPASVSNFVGDLVAMATAFERLPQVQADLDAANTHIESYAKQVQEREIRILELKAQIEAHLTTIRNLEAKLDSAETMFLEADDRTQRALDFIKATFGNAGSLIQALEPPAKSATPDVPVQAVPEAAPAAEPEVKAEPEGFRHYTAPLDGPDSPVSFAPPAPEVAPMQASPTQSDATTPMAETPRASASDTVSPEASATGDGPTPFSAPPIDRGKYHGMSYSEAHTKFGLGFTWPSRDEWLDNGGTLDNWYA